MEGDGVILDTYTQVADLAAFHSPDGGFAKRNIADALAMPGVADIGFEPPRINLEPRTADLS